jgi:hypothetical protein
MKHNHREDAATQNEAAQEQNKKASKLQQEGQHDSKKHMQGGHGNQDQGNMRNEEASKRQSEKQGNKK